MQEDQIKWVMRLCYSIGIGACALIFYDMREDVKAIKSKMENISDRVLTLEIKASAKKVNFKK